MTGLLALALALMASGGATRADLIAYEPFAYGPPGADLLGNRGGFGFLDDWHPGGFNASISTAYDIAAGSLAFSNLLTGGGSVNSGALAAIGGLNRTLATPLGMPGTTRYLSVLIRPEGTLNQGFLNGFFGLVLESPGEPELFFGKPGTLDQYVLENRGGAGRVPSGVGAVVGETVLLVVRAEFAQGVDRFTLYVNPTPGGPEPTTGTVKGDIDLGFVSGLTLYSTGAFRVDEIRLGTTFADVTPVPEPASLVLLGLGSVGLVGYARRRR